MRSRAPTASRAVPDTTLLQRKPALRIGDAGDRHEREADRAADAVVSGRGRGLGLSLSKISIEPPLQREEEGKPKPENEKYKEAAKKVGEAFLETAPGKEIKEKAEKLGDAFISTLPGKIIAGSAIAGAVATLAATHKELPIGIPEIPLDRIRPGLKMKITYEGPVDRPTKAMATFSIPLGPPAKRRKPAPSKSERFRAETARMAREQFEFRESLKTPQQRAEEQAMIDAWVRSRMAPPGSPLSLGVAGKTLPPPLAPYASEFEVTGEQPKREEPKKKKEAEGTLQRKEHGGASARAEAPAVVSEALDSSGQPLEPDTRTFMESRFGFDFRHVRIHTDARAARSARAVRALAYTVGRDIVFASGAYSPHTAAGRRVLAHELAHVVQQEALPAAGGLVQREDEQAARPSSAAPAAARPTPAAPPPPRQDFVFIMGQDAPGTGNPFYTAAERFYRAHVPNATFVTDLRNLSDLLDHVATNINQPIGNLFIVSHANEDGTLSFGLDSADTDNRLSVRELREALHPAGGASALSSVSAQIDAQTRIRVKGCDVGRTQQMVELLDEAFGGAGTVTAPTHEQVYGTDPTLERRARTEFRDEVEAAHPLPPEIDTGLRGRARQQALAERRAALRQRQRDIAAELAARRTEEDRLAERAGTYEALSGPMFQHSGTSLFTAAEIRPEVDRLYGHLSEAQRTRMVARLVTRDARPAAQAARQGTFRQRGQRVDRRRVHTFTFQEPQTLAEARRAFATDFRENEFRPTQLQPVQQQTSGSEIEFTFVVEGTFPGEPGEPRQQGTRTFTTSRPDDATLIASGRGQLPNPDRYAIRVDRQHAASGTTTLTVIAERVVAYLHHESLDPAAHEHFTRPESDPGFFATSTFAPPPPPPAATGGANP